jgi:hypothetical protein
LGVGAWLQNLTKDVRFNYTDTSGIPRALDIRYVGNANISADLTFDGFITEADWAIFIAGAHANMTGLSAAEAYQMGDLDGDFDNDIYDFDLFRQAFEASNPAAGAFEAMLAGYAAIPEPSSILLFATGVMGLGVLQGRRGR